MYSHRQNQRFNFDQLIYLLRNCLTPPDASCRAWQTANLDLKEKMTEMIALDQQRCRNWIARNQRSRHHGERVCEDELVSKVKGSNLKHWVTSRANRQQSRRKSDKDRVDSGTTGGVECDGQGNDIRDKAEWHKVTKLTFHALSLLCFCTFALLSFPPLCRSKALQRWTSNGQRGRRHVPSRGSLFTPNRLLRLQPSAPAVPTRTQPAELRLDPPSAEGPDKRRRTGLRGVDEQQTSQRVEHTIKLHLKPVSLLWCLSNGMELLDILGFINWISYWDCSVLVERSLFF